MWRQADQKNSYLGYESPVLTRQSSAFNSVNLGVPAVGGTNEIVTLPNSYGVIIIHVLKVKIS